MEVEVNCCYTRKLGRCPDFAQGNQMPSVAEIIQQLEKFLKDQQCNMDNPAFTGICDALLMRSSGRDELRCAPGGVAWSSSKSEKATKTAAAIFERVSRWNIAPDIITNNSLLTAGKTRWSRMPISEWRAYSTKCYVSQEKRVRPCNQTSTRITVSWPN